MEVRVRFAPSPTGPLHIGGVRTALFNYLFAKKHGGKFILRIEDTDQKRFVPGTEEYIIESLKWLSLEYDEGPDKGGDYAPYRQSERKDIYQKYVLELIDKGWAYYAFDTPEELENFRKQLQDEGSSVQWYNYLTRDRMKNSFTLPESEVKKLIDSGVPYVIRFKIPEDAEIEVYDTIRGKIKVHSSTLDDKVLFKSDGLPTYHLANVVDDHLMKISHVIRGEEWLPSLPLHFLLYEAFGWEKPQFAHLPLILKPTGKGKLSKRDGEKMGFPVYPLDWKDPKTGEISKGYREWGYLPEAVINMLALLGWNPGDDREIFTLDELINEFSLERVQKSGAKFDPEKAKWFNQQHLKRVPTDKIYEYLKTELNKLGFDVEEQKLKKIIELVRERAVFMKDFVDLTIYFFKAPENYDEKSLKKNWKKDTPEIITELRKFLSDVEPFESQTIEEEFKKWIETKNWGFGKVLNPLRILLVGENKGPHIFDVLELLGREEVLKRIDAGLEKLKDYKK